MSWEILRQVLELQGHWGLVSGDRAPGFRFHLWDYSENLHTRAGLPTRPPYTGLPVFRPSEVPVTGLALWQLVIKYDWQDLSSQLHAQF